MGQRALIVTCHVVPLDVAYKPGHPGHGTSCIHHRLHHCITQFRHLKPHCSVCMPLTTTQVGGFVPRGARVSQDLSRTSFSCLTPALNNTTYWAQESTRAWLITAIVRWLHSKPILAVANDRDQWSACATKFMRCWQHFTTVLVISHSAAVTVLWCPFLCCVVLISVVLCCDVLYCVVVCCAPQLLSRRTWFEAPALAAVGWKRIGTVSNPQFFLCTA